MIVDECRMYRPLVLQNPIESDLTSHCKSPEWSTLPLAPNRLQRIKHQEALHPLPHPRLPLHFIYLAE